MLTIDPKEVSTAKLQGYLQSAIGPRPIAFASTLDKKGKPNLSPFSFFTSATCSRQFGEAYIIEL